IGHTATWRRLAARVSMAPRRAASGLRAAFARNRRAAEEKTEAAVDEATPFVEEGREVESTSVEVGAGGD
ncbi:MAG: hypothetical protein M3348_14195, partial [Acidobacteriota bacterium]|nr:hypothetical protein [Acidobacteriota bacterium]